MTLTETLADLRWRGLLQDLTDEPNLTRLPAGTPFYLGIDPTAPSLQVGNLVVLMVSMRLTLAGLSPILLFGGATGSIGDPSGKSTERQLLDLSDVSANVKTQMQQVEVLWARAGAREAPKFVNNLDWTKSCSILDFLRDVGKHFPLTYMLGKETVKTRVSGDGISYTEFSYMLLQAFDYLHLLRTHGCKIQIGGSDQWGNMTAGLELIRRTGSGEAFALSVPLLTDGEGRKFGKSAGNALWLDPEKTSPYTFYQFWLNVADDECEKLLKIFTLYSRSELERIMSDAQSAPEKRIAQTALATAVTDLVHGPEGTQKAQATTQALFGGSLSGFSAQELSEVFADAPSTELPSAEIGQLSLLDLLARTLCGSKGEARRLLQGGGVYVNNNRVSEDVASLEGLLIDGSIVLRSGKKNYHLVKISA